jgi:uncharacterized membrane protein YdjX (TVP38/TMEM64 family)
MSGPLISVRSLDGHQAAKNSTISWLSRSLLHRGLHFVAGSAVVISPIPGELTGVVGGYVYGVTLGFATEGIAI